MKARAGCLDIRFLPSPTIKESSHLLTGRQGTQGRTLLPGKEALCNLLDCNAAIDALQINSDFSIPGDATQSHTVRMGQIETQLRSSGVGPEIGLSIGAAAKLQFSPLPIEIARKDLPQYGVRCHEAPPVCAKVKT
jgi:hypothetical protein